MAKGVVVRIERDHGYGFIQMEDGSEVFFHQRWLRGIKFRGIRIGTILEFELERGYRGLKAISIELATDDEDEEEDSLQRGCAKRDVKNLDPGAGDH
ncbi:MAG: cold shock domain-containing protein [candidate division Zixibacteria bacterium]|nr:cold shock domain-containing protein [candidate division Zixibacteria bacterium]